MVISVITIILKKLFNMIYSLLEMDTNGNTNLGSIISPTGSQVNSSVRRRRSIRIRNSVRRNETNELRRRAESIRAARRRALESEEAAAERKRKDSTRARARRSTGSPAALQKRRLLESTRRSIRRAAETTEATAIRRRYDAARAALRRTNEGEDVTLTRRVESRERMTLLRRSQSDRELSERWKIYLNKQRRLRIVQVKLKLHRCVMCETLLFSGETSSFCCLNGKLGITSLPPLPAELLDVYRDQRFRSRARRYNHRFAFSAMGVEGEQGFIEQPAPSCVKIHGRTYHKISGSTSKWLINDPLERERDSAYSPDIILIIENVLRRINPFVNQFETLGLQGTDIRL